MKKGRSLKDLAAELERRGESKRDFFLQTTAVKLHTVANGSSLSTLSIDAVDHEPFTVTEHTHRQIGQRLKIHANFYDRLRSKHPDLLDHTVNTLFEREPERRMIRTLDGNARAFLSDRYRRIDDLDVARAALPILAEQDDMRIESCEVTDRKLYLKAIFPKTQLEVRRGDPVQAGLMISNGEIGDAAFQVQPLVYRLVCDNGMIAADHAMKRYHVGKQAGGGEDAYEFFRDETLQADDRAILMKMQDVIRAVLKMDTFRLIVDRLQQATARSIEGDPVKAVEELSNRFNFRNEEQGSVLRHLVEGGDLSAWGVTNAITRTAHDVDSYDRATELEKFGGQVIELEPKDWKGSAEAA